jgi:hypothetical protein
LEFADLAVQRRVGCPKLADERGLHATIAARS